MNLLNLGASFGASVFIVCLYGLLVIMAVSLAVTLWKCVIRPLRACVHKMRQRRLTDRILAMADELRPMDEMLAEYRRMNHPRHLL